MLAIPQGNQLEYTLKNLINCMFKFPSEILMYSATLTIIVLGSVVHSTNKLRVAREKGHAFSVLDFLILMPISAFSGVIFGLFVLYFTENIYLVLLSAGIGSYLGVAGLNCLAKTVLKVLIDKVNK